MFEEAFCVLRMRKELFIFNQLYFVIDVSYENGKGVIFLSFARSFMCVV